MSQVQPSSAPTMPTEQLCRVALKHLHRGETRAFASLFLSRRLAAVTLVDFLVRERLGVFAYATIRDSKLEALFPPPVMNPLADQWRQQQARNRVLRTELAHISVAFREAGIDFLLLKGLYLSERFYGDLGRRFTWDLDLLVQPRDVRAALTTLHQLGFSNPPFTSGLAPVARHVTHAFECLRSDGSSVDLHWALRVLPGLRVDYDSVWSAARLHAFGEIDCRVPSDEHSLLLLLLGIAADLDRSLCRMRSLWDVYMLLHGLPGFDWDGFLARRVPEGSIGLVANTLSLVLHHLDGQADFPSLTPALAAYRQHITVVDAQQVSRMLALPPHSLANHLAFARWQPLPRWRYAAWWIASLPLRMFFARRI